MSLDIKETARLVELSVRPALFEQNGVGGVRYKVVQDGERFLVLILRDGVTPQVSRTRASLRAAKLEVENLVVIGRVMHGRRS